MKNKAFRPILDHIQKFIDDRNWEQFQNPKDLASAIVIESSELLEIFLWKTHEEVDAAIKDPKKFAEIKEEMADVLSYSLKLADRLGIDIEEAIIEKYKKNAAKYPVEKAKGKHSKYTEL